MFNLFIDSNILLNFYDYSKEDLSSLEKLINLIKKGTFKIKIYTTTTLKMELEKNREDRLRKAFEIFENSKIFIQMPAICKTYEEYQKIKKLQKELTKIKNEFSKKLREDMQNKKLKADEIIQELFKLSIQIDSEKYLENAIKRRQLGKPPGTSDKTYGDAINWESLLNELPDGENLIIISGDEGFRNPLNPDELHLFLAKEWEGRKKSKVFLYRNLNDFFNKHLKDIKIKIEKEKEDLINKLLNSESFSITHSLIQKLSTFTEFSDEQVKMLVKALMNNTQVRWIATDSDVYNFYKGIIRNKKEIFSEKELEIIQKILEGKYEPYEEIEVPF